MKISYLYRLFFFLMKNRRKMPVSEVTLLKKFERKYPFVIQQGITIGLFYMHFSLYHHLYILADILRKTPYRLHMDGVYCYLVKPRKGFCKHFSEGKFPCSLPTRSEYCHAHAITNNTDLRRYYLDEKNMNPLEALRIIEISKSMMKEEKQKEKDSHENSN